MQTTFQSPRQTKEAINIWTYRLFFMTNINKPPINNKVNVAGSGTEVMEIFAARGLPRRGAIVSFDPASIVKVSTLIKSAVRFVELPIERMPAPVTAWRAAAEPVLIWRVPRLMAVGPSYPGMPVINTVPGPVFVMLPTPVMGPLIVKTALDFSVVPPTRLLPASKMPPALLTVIGPAKLFCELLVLLSPADRAAVEHALLVHRV